MKKQDQVNKLHKIDENETYNSPASPENKNLTKILEKENNIPNDPLYFSPEKSLQQEKKSDKRKFTEEVTTKRANNNSPEQQRG